MLIFLLFTIGAFYPYEYKSHERRHLRSFFILVSDKTNYELRECHESLSQQITC